MALYRPMAMIAFGIAAVGVGGTIGVYVADSNATAKIASPRSTTVKNRKRSPDNYYAFDVPFVINVPDSVVSVQMKLAVGAADQNAFHLVRSHDPAARSAVIVSLSDLGPGIVEHRVTRNQLKVNIKQAILSSLLQSKDKSVIDDVYITEFLIVGLDY